ncbi:hypothetical protein PG994_002309 [Apiospora phragmitis]|uniref:Uncharacterized protein n=1 Tax=Apiospora phragmitis TaxID=2905665 RepID=A0ABR1WW12_9PEZI
MASLQLLATVLLSVTGVFGVPTNLIATRQASEIPPDTLYLIEWYPNGCGNGNGRSLTGYEEDLASCVKFDGLFDPSPTDSAAVRFLFPGDGRKYQWKLFSGNTCGDQIAQGEGDQCFSVPVNQNVGAVIVYT